MASLIRPYIFRHSSAAQPKQHICVVGAGPAGLAALKIVKDSSQHKDGLWSVDAYEARDDIGGVWLVLPHLHAQLAIKQAHAPESKNMYLLNFAFRLPAPPTDHPPLTPMYDSLTTNLPHPIMSYPTLPFPPSTPLYPRANVVLSYLKQYAAHFDLTPHIHLSTSVESITRSQDRWEAVLSSGEKRMFDLVIVGNGHYRVPRVPSTLGISDWLASGRASHASYYRHPLPEHKGKTIMVVGAGPSGTDISADLRNVAATIIHSISGGASTSNPSDSATLRVRWRATEYRADGSVVFEDGTVELQVDHCILATGYTLSFPFLSSVLSASRPPRAPPLPSDLHDSGYHLFPLTRHLWPLAPRDVPAHTLVFLGLPVRVAPFPLLEAQARAVVRAFAQPSVLNLTQEAVRVMERVEKLRTEVGNDEKALAHAWHRFTGEEQFDYRDELNEWALGPQEGKGEEEGGKVPMWVKEAYAKKEVLRVQWRELEREGVAEQWVKGVGKGGVQEWIELMHKLIRRAEEKGDVDVGKGRL